MVGLMGLCACALCRSCGQWGKVDKGKGLFPYCLCVEQKLARTFEITDKTVSFFATTHSCILLL